MSPRSEKFDENSFSKPEKNFGSFLDLNDSKISLIHWNDSIEHWQTLVKDLETQLFTLRNEIKLKKTEEINWLKVMFQNNNYEKKFKVTFETVALALCGELIFIDDASWKQYWESDAK